MPKVRCVVVASMIAVLVAPSGAAAGGWWSGIDLDRTTVVVGQRVKVKAEVLFSSLGSKAEAREKHPFYVYLLGDFDYSIVEQAMTKRFARSWWSINSRADLIRVGRLVVRVSDRNLSKARASFIVPELAPGTYSLMFCDAGCAQPLADVIPLRGFTVVADLATARLAERNRRLEERVRLQTQQLAAARGAIRVARAEATNSESDLQQLQAKMRLIERRVAHVHHSPSESGWAYAGWLIAGALLAALVALVLHGRRSPGAVRDASNGWHATDKARAKELV